ncbi:MAG: hypothetical protein V3T23_04500 [Nitrososphaerales archaeon]
MDKKKRPMSKDAADCMGPTIEAKNAEIRGLVEERRQLREHVECLQTSLATAIEQLDALPKAGLSNAQYDNLMVLRALLLEGNEITVIELELCDGSCVNSPEGQCEECGDLEMRKEKGLDKRLAQAIASNIRHEHTCSVRREGGPILPCKACEAGILRPFDGDNDYLVAVTTHSQRPEEIETMADENEIREQHYERGGRMAWRLVLLTACKHLGVDDTEVGKARWIVEREEVIVALRDLCETFGDNNWPDNLGLGDVIEKHLARHLHTGELVPLIVKMQKELDDAYFRFRTANSKISGLQSVLEASRKIVRDCEARLKEAEGEGG